MKNESGTVLFKLSPFSFLKKRVSVEEFLRIGVITQPHGVKGEVKVYPTTDDMNRFEMVDTVILETKSGPKEMKIENVKFFKGMAILKLSGIHSMDEAETYRQVDIMIHRSDSPLEEGEYFISDLLQMDVYLEDGSHLGVLTDVYQTGANDVYEITKDNGKELLLPNIPSCILDVNVEESKMTVFVLPGLEEN